jgi:hypothetical protein
MDKIFVEFIIESEVETTTYFGSGRVDLGESQCH